jgi:hypothetical protein
MENRINEGEIQLNIFEILYILKKRILILIFAAIIGFGVFGTYSYFILQPQYTSTAMLYVFSKETTLTSLADLQIGSQLTKDYKIIISSRPVLLKVIATLNLDITYKELKKKLTVENPADTRILLLSIVDGDPEMSKQIVDAVAETASAYIGDLMEMVPPKIIEDGEIPQNKTSPHTKKNAALGAALGIMLVVAVTVIQNILDDSIKTEDDVAKYLDVPVLAVLPDKDEDKKINKRRK